ncbi:MAG: NAD-dependent succinate-semialdehyde dehydrogenase [Balneolia bacterium]|nr:NAD-dependent succinate-semialdehyde dehydrogenase [Balneolia bacterium]
MSFKSVNPVTAETIKEYASHTQPQVAEIISDAEDAFQSWKRTSFDERSKLMNRVAALLEERKDKLAELMTQEMGKTLKEGRSEAEKCAWVCRYYASHAENFLKDKQLESDASNSYASYQPLGVLLAIMPWNFPFWQVFRFAAPSLMAGNTALLKHASNVPGCASAIETLFRDAGFPKHVFQNLFISSENVEDVIADARVKAVTLTGSTRAGKSVAATAGKYLKKCVLELGGSDPYIILDDAPLKFAVEACVTSRLINAGQSCIAAKRFIVTEKNYDSFVQGVVQAMKEKVMGDPRVESTDIGPQARADLRDELHEQVAKSIDAGAKPLLGCEVPPGAGSFYPASVLANVQPGMPAFDEELFGPVAAIIKAKDKDDAIRLANKTVFGLGAAVFTADEKEGERIAREELDAGCCFVNDFVRSDPRLPFGGIKESGYGRELSLWGIHEFVNVKTVYVK